MTVHRSHPNVEMGLESPNPILGMGLDSKGLRVRSGVFPMNSPEKKTSGSSAACMYRWDQVYNQIKSAYSRKIRCHWSEKNHLMLQLKFVTWSIPSNLMMCLSCPCDVWRGCQRAGMPCNSHNRCWNQTTKKVIEQAAQSAATRATYSTRWWLQKYFLFSPLPGEMIQVWLIFSMGLKPPTSQWWVIISKAFFACRISQEQKNSIGWIYPFTPPPSMQSWQTKGGSPRTSHMTMAGKSTMIRKM